MPPKKPAPAPAPAPAPVEAAPVEPPPPAQVRKSISKELKTFSPPSLPFNKGRVAFCLFLQFSGEGYRDLLLQMTHTPCSMLNIVVSCHAFADFFVAASTDHAAVDAHSQCSRHFDSVDTIARARCGCSCCQSTPSLRRRWFEVSFPHVFFSFYNSRKYLDLTHDVAYFS